MQNPWNLFTRILAAVVAIASMAAVLAAIRYIGVPKASDVGNDLLPWSPFPEEIWLLVAFPILTAGAATVVAWAGVGTRLLTRVLVITHLAAAAYVLEYEWHVVRVLSHSVHLF